MDDEWDHILLQEWDVVSVYEPSPSVEDGKEKGWKTFAPDTETGKGSDDIQTNECLETFIFFQCK